MGGNQNPSFVPPSTDGGMMGGDFVVADDMEHILNSVPRQRQVGPAEAAYREQAKPKESVVKSMFKDIMP